MLSSQSTLLDMDKKQVVAAFIEQLESDLMAMKQAAKATHEAATNEESKPENEYDTRALEASYLAGAQAQRAGEIDETLSYFRTTDFKELSPKDPIQATALVVVKINGKTNNLLVMPKGGGVSIDFEGHHVQIVTPQSSLGQAVLGAHQGEEVEFEVAGRLRECEIISVH